MEVVQVVEHDQATEPYDHPPQDQDLDVVIATTAPANDTAVATNIVKGKRTKRQRPQSPVPFRMHVPPADVENQHQEGANASKSEEASSDICSNVQASEEECRWGGSTEEEEEIANCLILLAQGQSLLESSSSPSPISPKQQHQPPPKEIKFTSRKFLETPHGSKAGYYVYECKTCFKTFPSFQALGGHRASHMRPKKDDGPGNTRIITMTHHQYSLADEHENSYNNHNNVAALRTNNNSLSLDLGNKVLDNNLYNNIGNELGSNNNTNNGKRQRVHRCSTCGAEFSSGQALGGHMRRHRGPVGGGAVGGGLFGHGVVGYHDHQSVVVQQSLPALTFTRLAGNVNSTMEGENLSVVEACKLSLDLDLNLPAPPDQDDQSKLRTEPFKEEEDEDGAEQPRLPTPLPPPLLMLIQQQQEETPVLTPPPSLGDFHN